MRQSAIKATSGETSSSSSSAGSFDQIRERKRMRSLESRSKSRSRSRSRSRNRYPSHTLIVQCLARPTTHTLKMTNIHRGNVNASHSDTKSPSAPRLVDPVVNEEDNKVTLQQEQVAPSLSPLVPIRTLKV